MSTKANDAHEAFTSLSKARKLVLLLIFCLAFFLDTVNTSILSAAIPPISVQLNIANNESVWLLSAYQLTFAALLLVSGRLSDLYNPKWVFIAGSGGMGVAALVAGFIRSKVPLLVLRALMGAGGALTIPSAIHLLVHMYPDPLDQANAITAFGLMGAVGVVVGLLIGAAIVTGATWPWIFYFGAILSGLITISLLVLVPNANLASSDNTREEKIRRLKRLDPVGVCLFAGCLILFIYALTSGSSEGWAKAGVLAPLIISLLMGAGFFLWEAKIPTDFAALPPTLWKYENFAVLIIIAFIPYMWWGVIFPVFSWLWELVYEWPAMKVAIHFLPVALGIFPAAAIATPMQAKMRIKWVLLIGLGLCAAGTAFLPFADSPDKFWKIAFPGFILGTAGAGLTYLTLNIAVLAVTPPEVSGIVQALLTSVSQTGGALGVAIVTSIQTSVEKTHGGPMSFSGRAAGMWFLFAFTSAIFVITAVFMKDTVGPVPPPGSTAYNEKLKSEKEHDV